MSNLLRVASWNVNGIRPRLPIMERWIQNISPDILCIQEIRCPEKSFPAEDIKRMGYVPYIFGQTRINGVAILTKEESTYHENIRLNPL